MENVNWDILGCGDVCERKSGPPMYKTPHSALAAVMRRDAAKAADFARRHGVPIPAWTSSTSQPRPTATGNSP